MNQSNPLALSTLKKCEKPFKYDGSKGIIESKCCSVIMPLVYVDFKQLPIQNKQRQDAIGEMIADWLNEVTK